MATTIDPKFNEALTAAVLPVLKQFQVPSLVATPFGSTPITVSVPIPVTPAPAPVPQLPVGIIPATPATPKISKTVTVTTQAQVPAKLESGTEYLFARGQTFVVGGFHFEGLTDVMFGASALGDRKSTRLNSSH